MLLLLSLAPHFQLYRTTVMILHWRSLDCALINLFTPNQTYDAQTEMSCFT